MKLFTSIKYILLFYCILSTSFSNGQVTIGKVEAPISGALLQLTNMADENGVNSTKGLMLPRVHLAALNDITNGDITGVNAANKDQHIGLMVYNTNSCANNKTDAKGVYVWTGTIWEPISAAPELKDNSSFNLNTQILTDFEGNAYKTRIYGRNRWMLQNLRSIRAADGTYINCEEGVKLNHPLGHWSEANEYTIAAKDKIPEGDPITYMTKDVNGNNVQTITLSREEYADKFGLSYTNSMAHIACPKGWRHPTKRDWYDLFIEIFPENVNVNPNNTANGKPFYNMKPLKSDDFYYYSETYANLAVRWGGYDKNSSLNAEFNMLPAGGVDQNGKSSAHFGFTALYWSDSKANPPGYYPAIMYNDHSDYTYSLNLLSPGWISVRCVRDLEISLNRKELVMLNNTSSTELVATTFLESLLPDVRWKSSDTSIASVNEITGKITAHNLVGIATITAYVDYQGLTYEATCLVKVGEYKIFVDQTFYSLLLSQTPYTNIINDLNVSVAPQWASVHDIIWSSQNTGVLSIDEKTGVIQTFSEGVATITLTIGGNSGATPVSQSIIVEVRSENIQD